MKFRYFASAAVVASGFVCGAQAGVLNDDCFAAISIAIGAPAIAGDNSNATLPDAIEAQCAPDADYDVWYVYTPDADGLATIDTFGSAQLDPVLAIYRDCDSLDIVCDDDAGNDVYQARVVFPVQAGVPYFVRVASHAAPGPFVLNVALLAFPLNDTCGAALPLGVGVAAATGDNTLAASDAAPPGCQALAINDVWYAYTAAATGMTTIDTLGSGQSDPVLSIYDECLGVELACDDDFSPDSYQSLVVFSAVGGHTYLVRLSSYGAPGPFQLNVRVLEAPDNDHCSTARAVSVGIPAAVGDNTLAGDDLVEVSCAPSDYDVWFDFVGCGGMVHVDTHGSEQYDPVLTIFDGCNGNEIICVDDDLPQENYQAGLQFQATAGVHYLIRLGSRAAPGPYRLSISCLEPPANDDCSTAQPITAGFPAAVGDNSLAGPDLVEASCAAEGDYDVWFRYTAPCTGISHIDTFGSVQPDTELTVYETCGGPELVCDDDSGDSREAKVRFAAVAGHEYLIRLASHGPPGPYVLNILCLAEPTDETCETALPITNGSPAAIGDNTLGHPDLIQPSCGSNSTDAVWYEYVATCDGTVTIDTFGSVQTDPMLTVYDDCGGAEVACNDDAQGLEAQVRFEAFAGQRFKIRLASVSAPGPYQLNVHCDPNTPPMVFINAPFDHGSIRIGTPIQFWGAASDIEDGELTDTLQWTSDRDGPLGIGAMFTRALSGGLHVITAQVADRFGASGVATARFAVIVRGDVNCDGVVNNFDIDPFVLVITFPELFLSANPDCPLLTADIDGDDAVTNFDVDPFVACILNQGCP